MSIDLTKLTPSPWTYRPSCVGPAYGFDVPEPPDADYRDSRFGNEADAAFIALARNAYDVMIRRGWHAQKYPDGWGVADWLLPGGRVVADCPFAALVEADMVMRERECDARLLA